MPDDDRFPKKYGRGWGPATKSIHSPMATAADGSQGAVPGHGCRDDDTALSRAVAQTIEIIPPGSLNFEGVATEVQRIARLIQRTDPADVDLCGLFGLPSDDESVHLLAKVARLLVATMGGDLVSMSTNEITWLLARHFLRALARQAGTDRVIPFTLGPDASAPDVLKEIRRELAHPSMDELIPILLEGQGRTSGGTTGVT